MIFRRLEHHSGNSRSGARAALLGVCLLALALPALLAGCFRNGEDSGASSSRAPGQTPDAANIEPVFTASGGAFSSPLRMVLTSSGWLLVSDPKRKSVHRVDPDSLHADRSLRIEGTPLAIGMLGEDIFVGVKESHAVEIFSHTGSSKGFLSEPGTVDYPGDLAIEENAGRVFVLDGIARNVKVFGIASRSLVETIGSGLLLAPAAVVIDPSRQEVLVSDYGSPAEKASVKVFSYAPGNTGDLLATLTAGSCNFMGCTGGFSRPRGLAVRNARIFLADALLGQVLIFDRTTLQKVGELGSSDPASRVLRLPSDIAINAAGDVFVTGTLSKSIVVFRGGAL